MSFKLRQGSLVSLKVTLSPFSPSRAAKAVSEACEAITTKSALNSRRHFQISSRQRMNLSILKMNC